MVSLSPLNCQPLKTNTLQSAQRNRVSFGEELTQEDVQNFRDLKEDADTPEVFKKVLNVAIIAGSALLARGAFKAGVKQSGEFIRENKEMLKIDNIMKAKDFVVKHVKNAIKFTGKKLKAFGSSDIFKPVRDLKGKVLQKFNDISADSMLGKFKNSVKEKADDLAVKAKKKFTGENIKKASIETGGVVAGIAAAVEVTDEITDVGEVE